MIVSIGIRDRQNAAVGDIRARRRLGEIALRVALISSAMNGDPEVTQSAMSAALRFAEWQEKIRGGYRPGMPENKDAEALEAISAALAGKRRRR